MCKLVLYILKCSDNNESQYHVEFMYGRIYESNCFTCEVFLFYCDMQVMICFLL